MRSVTLLIVFILFPSLALSSTLRIPRDFASIQLGIDAAQEGDTVLVDRGTYLENIDFKGKAITVKSAEGHQFTTIDGNSRGSVVSFKTWETEQSVLEGFTLTHGSGTLLADEEGLNLCGGAIYCHVDTSPTIKDNFIIENEVKGLGGGIFCHRKATPKIKNNTIRGNKARSGGGLFCYYASAPVLIENSIYKNKASSGGAIYCSKTSRATIRNNFIGANSAGEGYDEIEGDTNTSVISENTYE